MRLLIVEDDAPFGNALATGLRQLGPVVDWFRRGDEADAMLPDLDLPGRDGQASARSPP